MEIGWLKACLKLRSLSTFLDKRQTSGQSEYLAQWSPSLLDQIDIKRRKDGSEFVEIGNHILDVKLSVYKGAFQAWVYWENTWLPRSTALELSSSDEKVFDALILDKPIPLHSTQRLLEDRKFIPKARGDYTCSFLRELSCLRSKVQADGIAIDHQSGPWH
ncbi:hypothetical protein HII31_13758 [Pseudocercospora fuligena]|uniref:Uncharacterized protein n=1 Tax=Pseudocercospora fuligena TaxID=685502 RepID=A0A8H6VBU2_9PEZI|nr:hypothetical protein HII31_13758 [Pseudocercospora fuligena]